MARNIKRTIVGQIARNSDLYDEITRIVRTEGIRFGRILGIGGSIRAVVAYYDQKAKEYRPIRYDDGMEILSLQGNISTREDLPFVHVHAVLSDRNGRCVGGHLMQGTVVWACEITIDEFDGEPPVRTRDEGTGLFLWNDLTL